MSRRTKEVTVSMVDIHSPLYLHPSKSITSLTVEKLQGVSNNRLIKKDKEDEQKDEQKAEQKVTCNNMVIARLHASVSKQIKMSILFYVSTACEVWRQLERTFNVANGSRKYKSEKEMMGTKQNGANIYEFTLL
ncbi:Copine-3 [Bienertia sinuspersici]